MFWVQLTELEQNIFFALLQLTDNKLPTTPFNSQIRLTLTDHTLTTKTQINTPSNALQLIASWSLIKYKPILGHVQLIALLSNLSVSFTRLPYLALLCLAGINSALPIWALLLPVQPA